MQAKNKDFVQYQSETYGTLAPTYKGLKRSFIPRTIWNMSVGFLRHQILCKWQQEEVCIGLAYSIQRVVGENRYQSLEGGGVGGSGRYVPIVAEGGTFILLEVMKQLRHS